MGKQALLMCGRMSNVAAPQGPASVRDVIWSGTEDVLHTPDALTHLGTNEVKSQDLKKDKPLKHRLCMTQGQGTHQHSSQAIRRGVVSFTQTERRLTRRLTDLNELTKTEIIQDMCFSYHRIKLEINDIKKSA